MYLLINEHNIEYFIYLKKIITYVIISGNKSFGYFPDLIDFLENYVNTDEDSVEIKF